MSDQVIKAFEELRVKGLVTPEKDYASFVAGFNAGRDVRLALLAADHKGMRVDYSGLLKQSIGALRRGVKEPGLAEMLRQLQGHITELGRRWYCGDTAVVDELLQLYAVEDRARDALKLQGSAQQNPAQVNRIPAGLYAELKALRTLRDATGIYLQGYMRDEIDDEDNCVSVDQHDAACTVKAALDSAKALEWKGGEH